MPGVSATVVPPLPPVSAVEVKVKPPTFPPVNNTVEPVICPSDFNLRFSFVDFLSRPFPFRDRSRLALHPRRRAPKKFAGPSCRFFSLSLLQCFFLVHDLIRSRFSSLCRSRIGSIDDKALRFVLEGSHALCMRNPVILFDFCASAGRNRPHN